ncbi:MAG: BT_3928 family protein [Bacteroidales bacterium]
MKVIANISRLILGVLFVVSGFVKGIDPWGSAYLFHDYFEAFGWEGMYKYAFAIGVLLSAVEFTAGLALLCKFKMRFTAWLTLLFMLFFTPFTLYLWIADPIQDCGCFGDAIKLSNIETFLKNLLFLPMSIAVFAHRKKFKSCGNGLIGTICFSLFMLTYVGAVWYSYEHLPIMDFRPYKIGNNIAEQMIIPADAPEPVYNNTYTYRNKKTGEEEKFTEADIPWQDTLTWEYISTETNEIEKGFTPAITDFAILGLDGSDVTNDFLDEDGYLFLFTSERLSNIHADSALIAKINKIGAGAYANYYSFIGLTSSPANDCYQYIDDKQLTFEFYNTDEKVLKTMIRSNPGLMLLKDGTIIRKWHYNDIPSLTELENIFLNK